MRPAPVPIARMWGRLAIFCSIPLGDKPKQAVAPDRIKDISGIKPGPERHRCALARVVRGISWIIQPDCGEPAERTGFVWGY